MSVFLRIKADTLAVEARIIRRWERRFLQSMRRQRSDWSQADPLPKQAEIFWKMRHHRLNTVRKECRHTNLAVGFLRGRRYRQIEEKCYEAPNWAAVEKMIERYADGDIRDLKQRFSEWKSEPPILPDGCKVSWRYR